MKTKEKNEKKAKIVVLSGSTRFKKEHKEVAKKITLEGNIVIPLSFYEKSDGDQLSNDEVDTLVDLHYKKIDMCDTLFVVNPDGYIGENTMNELQYAIKRKKDIVFLENYIKFVE